MITDITAISLFAGAGGMDVGFKKAGINVIWANEIDKDACNTYRKNNPETELFQGDINLLINEGVILPKIDIVFGGPPCQGFSVAGKMNPDDERSKLIWAFLKVVEEVHPKIFVMENVKALAKLEKWQGVREQFLNKALELGYQCVPLILNASDFGVPQNRERVFFIGVKNMGLNEINLRSSLNQYMTKNRTIRETLMHLGRADTEINPKTCTAKITFASNPILRKSPYAGMLFNGMGRPINVDGVSNTLPASMGGNKTPIIDEEVLLYPNVDNWIVEYHKGLLDNTIEAKFGDAPERLRRITIKEASLIQTFPRDYIFEGSKTSIYKQIGNAVPCDLAYAVASVIKNICIENNEAITK